MTFNLDKWVRSPAGRSFKYYDPYLTYSKSDNQCFIDPNEKKLGDLNPDTDALFRVGKEAFKLLTKGIETSKEEFDEAYAAYFTCLDELRKLLCEVHSRGGLVLRDEKGQRISPDIRKIADGQVAPLAWAVFSSPRHEERPDEGVRNVFRELFLFNALREIDDALIRIALDDREAVVAAVEASNALSNAVAIASVDEQRADARRQLAYEGAIEKLRRDPKQREKAFVRECWEKWQQKLDAYRSKAAFARDMLNKCEHLESAKKIEDWCRQWEASRK